MVTLEPERADADNGAAASAARLSACASLLCEGGPTLFGSLLGEGLVDELFLTLAPKLTGGGRGPTISSGTELSEPWALTVAVAART